ncbi:hypothetical protein [Enhygromyxa salina]|uniref:Uncharacterized protein n=1 Tax=Enhygromyxa salina TaxID=215803 RepID=A0A2S9YM73_9BACT|nr:hypothetical protein [Enhygromyxa salina]PRQ06191.1 hypothetical protein ENSA7_41090 [Enhygromyxa salina]
MHSKDDAGSALVLVVGMPTDAVAASVAARLRGSFQTVSVAVESISELRETVERYGARLGDQLGALVVGAASSTAASTLVWDLDRSMRWVSERTLVVVDSLATLDEVPKRLLEALPYRAVSEGALDDLAELVELLVDRRPPLDLLATLVRTAIERRSVDSLPPLLGDWSSAETLAPERLVLAHVDDGGRRPNPLWAHWSGQRDAAAIERLGARVVAHERWLARANSRVWQALPSSATSEPAAETTESGRSVQSVQPVISKKHKGRRK